MEDNGIAWMIAGGLRAQSAEDQRQRFHRLELARRPAETPAILLEIRRRIAANRIAAILEGRWVPSASTIEPCMDGCPA
jgi:hypothetical protein